MDDKNFTSSQAGNEISYAMIHPGIGIARVGNSESEYYVGPEYANSPPPPLGSTRDNTGAIKRQAARFRIYGYDKDGNVVKELTSDNADIEWQVEVANTKASWYMFDAAMDLPDAKAVGRRNPLIVGEHRKELEIRPPVKKVSGRSKSGIKLEGGKFKSVSVNLGELRTDESGRLLFLGGLGVSASPSGAPLVYVDEDGVEHNFNNSVDWYDDISDGPVSATVNLGGEVIPVTSAWVVVAPPDYAPGIVPFRTMYDLAKNTVVSRDLSEKDNCTSYKNDILPLIRRLSESQWVNLGFAQSFGSGGAEPITTKLIKELVAPENHFLRFEFYSKFRSPHDFTVEGGKNMKWPQLYGDGFASATPSLKGDLLHVEPAIYKHLANFVLSDFINDLEPDFIPEMPEFPEFPYDKPIEESPIAEQPARLDEGPLSYCCADAFHPGCELTWPMRHASMYSEVVRINRRDNAAPIIDYGDELSSAQALDVNGPLNAQGPGDLTRWMAIPWQGDTARCRSGYDDEFHPYLPSFWPAKVPNEVLSEKNYHIYNNTGLSDVTRLHAFQQRDSWLRTFLLECKENECVMKNVVSRFDELGIVQRAPAPPDYASHNGSVFVEQLKPGTPELPDEATAFSGNVDGSEVDNKKALLELAGWTEAEWKAFQRKR